MLILLTALEGEFSAKSTVDDTLIKRIANGDMEAFRLLYDTASSAVYGFALSVTANSHDAEDVLQDTFLTVLSSAANYRPMGKPMAWIFTIARNHALMCLRKNSITTALDDQNLVDYSSLERIESVENRSLIEALMNLLNSEEKQIVMLHAAACLKNREIAALLELPLNTVLSKYNRAIKKLQAKVEKDGILNGKKNNHRN